MKIKKFLEWSGYDPGSQESFIERYEKVVSNFEKIMIEDGMDLGGGNIDLFVQDLEDLKVEDKFEDDLSDAASKWFEQDYYKGYDREYGEPLVNDEYVRIEREAIAKASKSTTNYYQQRTAVNDALLTNLIENHWEAWKNIYKKWVKYIHDHRGTIAAKGYNV